jgi:hypothetical protein
MPANKKVRSRRARTAKDIAMDLGSVKEKPQQLARHALDLRDQIHRLECFIASAPALARQQKLASYDIVPPMEPATPKKRKPTRLTLQQQMALRRHRLRLLAEFSIVSITVIGLAGWLNHWFNVL